jgi:ubiquinone/menaquinone biosynthesis C-methylase UbiE
MTGIFSEYFSKYTSSREAHWERLAVSYNHNWASGGYHAKLVELYQNIIPKGCAVLEIGCGKGELLASLEPSRGVGIDFCQAMLRHASESYPSLEFIQADAHDLGVVSGPFDVIIFSDLVNDLWDVQCFLTEVRRLCTSSTRIVCNMHSNLWALPLRFLQTLGLATPMLPQNWLTVEDMCGLLNLAGFDVVSHRREILFPLDVPVVASLFNRYLAKLPLLHHLDMTNFIVSRPSQLAPVNASLPSVTVIIPARNEAGNIAEILERVPQMGRGTEIIFVENASSDNTFEVIESEISKHPELNCRVFRQPVTGKAATVRLGYEQATGDILMILDADMTVAPEDLAKFYLALVEGHGEFINGVRLVYPMHEKAMRFFNLIGNKFFSLAFSWLLGQTIKDTLCGTKVLWKRDYLRLADQREYFGNFDPFGDFDLLFGAARLNLKIIDLPVRYGERTYGTTNIKRWSHGWLLLRMVIFAARRLKFV